MEARRRVAFLIAEKSMRRKFIGGLARAAGAVPVARALDNTKAATGKIYLPDPVNTPKLIRGTGTKFDREAQIGGLLVLPSVNGTAANAEILEIRGPEEIYLKNAFKGAAALKQLTGREDVTEEGKFENGNVIANNVSPGDRASSSFKTAPKVDQTMVYDAVFERLDTGGCVGIFPEGGSHDRTELLPLKGASKNHMVQVIVLTWSSWCSNHGPRVFGCESELGLEDYPLRHELFPCSQI